MYCEQEHEDYNYYVNDANEKEYQQLFNDLSYLIYKALEKEYEYINSEEAFIEWAECNDVNFLESGSVYND